MKFIDLFERLDTTQKRNEKLDYLRAYFTQVNDDTAVYAIHALTNAAPEKAATSAQMKKAAQQVNPIPKWLFKECYSAVGDLSETISLLVSGTTHNDDITDWYRYIRRLRRAKEYQKHVILKQFYTSHSSQQCFLFNKLLTGTFRVGVGKKTVVKALSDVYSVEEVVLKRRLLSSWNPRDKTIQKITEPLSEQEKQHKPFPFYLAYPVEDIEDLEDVTDWLFEPKYDGIRVQCIIGDTTSVWSRKGELLTSQFPEIQTIKTEDSYILDGELLAYDKKPLPFTKLQKRLGRENPSHRIQNDIPIRLIVYDVLRYNGEDFRNRPLEDRQSYIPTTDLIQKINQYRFDSWSEAKSAMQDTKKHGVEGFMVKRKTSVYKDGRVKGDWWKWKHEPYTVDCVLLYAESGRGKRAGKYTDYTFGVWKQDELVPITRAYSGLTNNEIEEVDGWIKRNTKNTFGPVKEVAKEKVVEIAFQSIAKNTSKKAGFSLRFPRIKRIRTDLSVEEADSVQTCTQIFKSLQH